MVLMTIIANCIVLALEEHLPEYDKTPLTLELVGSPGVSLQTYSLLSYTVRLIWWLGNYDDDDDNDDEIRRMLMMHCSDDDDGDDNLVDAAGKRSVALCPSMQY